MPYMLAFEFQFRDGYIPRAPQPLSNSDGAALGIADLKHAAGGLESWYLMVINQSSRAKTPSPMWSFSQFWDEYHPPVQHFSPSNAVSRALWGKAISISIGQALNKCNKLGLSRSKFESFRNTKIDGLKTCA